MLICTRCDTLSQYDLITHCAWFIVVIILRIVIVIAIIKRIKILLNRFSFK